MKNLWRYVLSIALCSSTIMAEFVRFDAHEVVVDVQQGLMWQDDNASKTAMWLSARDYCENLSFTEFSDWYLPTKDELISIVDKSNSPTIVSGFNNTASKRYWSDSQDFGYALSTNEVWYVDFSNGGVYSGFKSNDYYVRCVRKGKYVDPMTLNIASSGNGSVTRDKSAAIYYKNDSPLRLYQILDTSLLHGVMEMPQILRLLLWMRIKHSKLHLSLTHKIMTL